MCYIQKDDLQIQTQNRGNYLPCVFTLCTEAIAQVTMYRKRIQNNAKQAKQAQKIIFYTYYAKYAPKQQNEKSKLYSYHHIVLHSCCVHEPVPEGRIII